MGNKFFLAVLTLGLCFGAIQNGSAQITITKSNMPTAGQSIIYSTSNDSIDVSATGADTTWDFSQITPVSQDTYKYVSPSSASILYTLQFSGDAALNIKIAGLKGAYEFFKTSATQYTSQGLGITLPVVNLPTSIPYTNPDVIYNFPLKYGNTADSASFYGSTTITTFTIKFAGKRTNIIDGWGKVITPYKTYNCIRVKSIVKEVDSLAGQGINRDRIEYKWLSTSEQIPVFEVVVAAGAAGTGSTQTITYRDSFKNVVNPNGPVVDFNVPDTNVYTNDTVTFNNTTTAALTYSWVITPSTFTYGTGSTSTTKNPKIIFNKVGLYTVSLNATGIGGTNYLTKKDYINATHNTGIEPANGISQLQLYPNPTTNGVQVSLGSNINGNIIYSIINASGKTVNSGTIASNNGVSHLSMKDYTPGLYLIRMQSGEQVFEGRVVKE